MLSIGESSCYNSLAAIPELKSTSLQLQPGWLTRTLARTARALLARMAPSLTVSKTPGKDKVSDMETNYRRKRYKKQL